MLLKKRIRDKEMTIFTSEKGLIRESARLCEEEDSW
jgi:hypothetical protein